MKKFLGVLIRFILFFMGWAVLIGLIPTIPSDKPVVWRFGAELIPFMVMIIFTLIFWLRDKNEIHISILGRFHYNLGIGMVAGFIWIGSTAGILIITGIMKFNSVNTISLLWLWILSAFLNVIMQELLVRGYLYQLIKKRYNIAIAVLFSTALFTLLHGGAFEAGIVPVLNVITMSLFMTEVLEYTESLLAPIIIHFIWNAVGAIILGGVSLADDYPNLINTTLSGNQLISGGIYKMEGSIVVLILNIVFTYLFIRMKRRKI
jgi:uncharacterized protein